MLSLYIFYLPYINLLATPNLSDLYLLTSLLHSSFTQLFVSPLGYTAVISDFNQVSKWWEEIRKEITSSSHVFPIYSFSIACRAVAIDLQHQGPTEVILLTLLRLEC